MAGEKRHWWWHRPFLYIGRMAEDKGVVQILNAWQELKSRFGEDCPPLWLVGGSPEEIDSIRELTGWREPLNDWERKGDIVWWGYIDSAGVSALLCRSMVVVMHSRYEPGGRVVLESMAQGVPVIATPYGFATELVKDWETGFLIEFGEQEVLVARMAHFVRQPLLRNVLGADAKRAASNMIQCLDFMGTHCAVYEKVVAGKEVVSELLRPGSTSPEYAHYRNRRVLPTYPVDEAVPSEEAVISLVEKTAGTTVTGVEAVTSGPGSSLRWRAQAAKSSWIVKWPYTRLNKSILWSTFPEDNLLTRGQIRFDREVLSGTMPGFIPWDGADEQNQLLIRREFKRPKTCSPETIAMVSTAYKNLATAPFDSHGLGSILYKDWREASHDEVIEGHGEIRRKLKGEPWDLGRLFSLRLAWRMLELNMRSNTIPRGLPIPEELFPTISLFVELAETEVTMPITMLHGSGDMQHCLWRDDGSLGLIDGEHIHPGLAGEDLAALVYFAVEDNGTDRRSWPALMEAVTENNDEWDLLLSWMGYLAVERVLEVVTLLKHDKYDEALNALFELTRLAQQRLTR